ncbi:MAG: hypothetical protein CMJ83_10200 [Planctomycetes bacterium]|nr:hypothetical protein [Planctomycetota bacterium]
MKGSISIVTIFVVLILFAVAGFFVLNLMDEGAEPEPARIEEPAPTETGDGDGVKTPPPISNGPPKSLQPRPAPPVRKGVPTELAGTVQDAFGNVLKDATVQIITYVFDRASTRRMHERFQRKIVQQTTTDDEGEYKFEKLTPGALHYIEASAPEYIAQIKDSVRVGLRVNFTLKPGARVEGVITDTNSGQPVEGVKVRGWFKTPAGMRNVNRLYRWQETVHTKKDGSYVFEAVPAETVKFMLYHDEYEDFQEDQEVAAQRTNRIDFKITRGIVVVGVLVDKLSNEPIPRVTVAITDGLIPKQSTKTDENGVFRATGLTRGTQIFQFRADGFTSMRDPREIGNADDYVEEKNNQLVFRLDPAGSAAGVVMDPDGNPIANARVFVAQENPLMKQVRGKAEFRTQANGQFLVKNLGTSTTYVIAAHVDGYGIGVSQPIQVGPAELRDDVVVRLRRGSSITGVVTDENNSPISGVRMQVAVPPFADVWFPPGMDLGQQANKVIVTGDNGRFALQGLWKGAFSFSLTHDRHVPMEKQRVMIKDVDQQVTRDFSMKIGRFLAGTCLDDTGRPAQGAMVTVTRPWSEKVEARVEVDADGKWRVDGLVKGTYRVQARKPKFSSEAFNDIPADSGNLHFRLRGNGGILGAVQDSTGQPVKVFSLSLVLQFDGTAEEAKDVMPYAPKVRNFRDESGLFHMDDIDPGEYILAIRSPSFAEYRQEHVRILPSDVSDLGTIRLPIGGTVVGTVVDDQGEPVRSALVTVRVKDLKGGRELGGRGKLQKPATSGPGGFGDISEKPFAGTKQTSWTGRVMADATYRVSGLPAGEYVVLVQSGRYVAPAPAPVVVTEAQETRKDFKLVLAGTVIITVNDDVGDPVIAAAALIRDSKTGRRPAGIKTNFRTDARGTITIGNVPPGDYVVTIQRSGYISREVNITMNPGQQVRKTEQIEKLR